MVKGKGRVILCHTPFKPLQPLSYFNLLIRKGSKSRFDHMIVETTILGRDVVIHALFFRGVIPFSKKRYIDSIKSRSREHYLVEDATRLDIDYIVNNLGTKYSNMSFIRIPLYLLCKKILGCNNKITMYFYKDGNKNKNVCFEFGGGCLGLKSTSKLTGKYFEKNYKLKPINLNEV